MLRRVTILLPAGRDVRRRRPPPRFRSGDYAWSVPARYVFGGRGDVVASARRTIWAIDPGTGGARRVAQLPLALSDLSAATLGQRILVVGGRGADGRVGGRVLEYAER
jgi:hypothetical protein